MQLPLSQTSAVCLNSTLRADPVTIGRKGGMRLATSFIRSGYLSKHSEPDVGRAEGLEL
jgi:hypothetical protein